MNEWKGIGASPGYAIGQAYVLPRIERKIGRVSLEPDEIEAESVRLEEKVELAVCELEELRERASRDRKQDRARILSTHITLLRDPEFVGEIALRIRSEARTAESALGEVTEELISVFELMDDERMKERAADLRDVQERLWSLLDDAAPPPLPVDGDLPVILIGHDIAPSVTAGLDRERIAAFAADIGGTTSHSAIIARALGLPAVVGAGRLSLEVRSGDTVIVDGGAGLVIAAPDAEALAFYRQRIVEAEERRKRFDRFRELPTATADGRRMELAVNIAHPREAEEAQVVGAEGIGLYRSEFLFMDRQQMPGEEEQFNAYKSAVLSAGPQMPVVIRTLDAGGDKAIPYLRMPEEENPFLGYRAIRLCLDSANEELFKTQLRAILRASGFGNVKMMYPMIATLQELRHANRLLADARKELDDRREPYNGRMEVGIMIEIPSAALIADQLAREVDFFSIGTNDLVQYAMAADRMNERVAYLTQPLHPSILRLIDLVAKAARAEGKWVGMCGEMAGQPSAIPILVGMGLDELSMSPGAVLPARELISRLQRSEMERLAERALRMTSAEEVERLTAELLQENAE